MNPSDAELQIIAAAEALDRRQCEEDLYWFLQRAWPVVEGGRAFSGGFAVEAMCKHLEEVFYGRCKRLLINIPPRSTKSTLISVVFPVWCWIKDPALQLMTVSYAEKFAKRDNVKSRRLLKSEWFQARWGSRFQLSEDQDTKNRVDNMQGGYRVAVGLDSGITGEGAECFVAGTRVLCVHGYRNIENVKVGDRVVSWNFELGLEEPAQVVAVMSRPARETVRVTFANGAAFRCTPEHQIYIEGREWVPAHSLKAGDISLTMDGGVAVREVVRGLPSADVYDIQVEGNHCFFAEGVLVHNCIILDDPNSASDLSETALDNALDVFTEVLPTRFNNFKTGRMIVVQQRVHERDVSGWILANQKDDYAKLILPMEYESERRCVTIPVKGTDGRPWEDPRTEDGELLMPGRIGSVELKRLKQSMRSEYAIAGQLQQRPAPAEGGLIKRSWFKPWKEEYTPRCTFIIQSWDTGLVSNKKSSYSACTTWGIFKDDQDYPSLILLGAWRKRVEFPELYEAVQRMSQDYAATTKDRPISRARKPDLVMVEEKASGIPLIQTFNKSGALLTPWRPDKYGDKVERVRRVTHLLESGRVYIPMRAPDFKVPRGYAELLVSQAITFPNAESRDLVDTLTMTLQRVINSGWVLHPVEKNAMLHRELEREMSDSGGRALY